MVNLYGRNVAVGENEVINCFLVKIAEPDAITIVKGGLKNLLQLL